MAPLRFERETGWFGESIVLTLTTPGNVAVAVRLVSQVTGPSKWTLHGFGAIVPGQIATCLVRLYPEAARAATWTGSSLTWRVSTWTTIGGGCGTVTRGSVALATMVGLTAALGTAR